MCVFAVRFVLILIWTWVKLSQSQCVQEKEYFCSAIPDAFPERLTSILFVVTKIGIINSTVFDHPNLQSVTSLALANSGITKIEPGAFYAFQSLTKLSLYRNNLTTIMAAWLSNPGRLENLTLSQNIIEEIGPHMLSRFVNLTTLILASNRIHKIATGSLKSLLKLTFVDLSNNNLSMLSRSVFSGLLSTAMKLGNNPWNCSCELQDFGVFLQELMNASLLEDASSVVCRSPPNVNGIPVWNISDFNCPSALLSPLHENGFYKTGLPAVLVCLVLLSLVLLLLLLLKVKQDKKHIQPGRGTTSEMHMNHVNKTTERLGTRGLPGDKVKASVEEVDSVLQTRMVKGRAKSASAVMSRTEFPQGSLHLGCVAGGNQEQTRAPWAVINEQSCMENKDGVRTANSLQDGDQRSVLSQHVNFPSTELSTQMPTKDTCEVPQQSMQDSEIPETFGKNESKSSAPTENLEPLLYLSVVSTMEEPPTRASAMEEKMGVVTSANEFVGLKRVSTWPYEKSKGGPRQGFLNNEAQLFVPISDLGMPTAVRETEFQDEQRRQGNLYRSTGNEPHELPDCSTPQTSIITKETKPVKELASPLRKESKHEALHFSQPRKALKDKNRVKTMQFHKSLPSPAGTGKDNQSSPLPSDRTDHTGSPGDNTLLEDNEYSFIDLLHEVVENHGRWTRERWKRTHQTRINQPLKKSK